MSVIGDEMVAGSRVMYADGIAIDLGGLALLGPPGTRGPATATVAPLCRAVLVSLSVGATSAEAWCRTCSRRGSKGSEFDEMPKSGTDGVTACPRPPAARTALPMPCFVRGRRPPDAVSPRLLFRLVRPLKKLPPADAPAVTGVREPLSEEVLLSADGMTPG